MSENGSAPNRAASAPASRAAAPEPGGPPGPGTIPLQRERAQTIFEQGAPGRSGASLPPNDVPDADPKALFGGLAREEAPYLPEVSEVEVTRHYTRLSRWNYAIDIGLYPLGSCTMKYNPKVNEKAARMPGFAGAVEGDTLLVAVTERHKKEEIDRLARSLDEVCP